MIKNNPKYILIMLSLIFLGACSSISTLDKYETIQLFSTKLDELKVQLKNKKISIELPKGSFCSDYNIEYDSKEIVLYMSKEYSNQAFREDKIKKIYDEVKTSLGKDFYEYELQIITLGVPIEELVPNIYRTKIQVDSTRLFVDYKNGTRSIVKNISKPFLPSKGLSNRNIALWHSHGWYYNHKFDRWMWQRARLFGIVEDLGPMAFTIPYIIPMLENAGANVYVPRERDLQANEVVVDDDKNSEYFVLTSKENFKWQYVDSIGFGNINNRINDNTNPFSLGGYSFIETSKTETATARYVPNIPEIGEYAVYISYYSGPKSTTQASYIINHLGGKTSFNIDQTMGGGSWIYLGTFKFKNGIDAETGSVLVSNENSEAGTIVSTDAVRFGGGKGIIARNGITSNKPKYLEAARYWLQYSGVPDTLVYSLNGDTLDYNDDYQSRGEWVNYLVGAPFGPNKKRTEKGLNIPIDVSLAFHTDAGVSKSDTTIGTLAIYSVTDLDSNLVFPNGVSRLANRDFTDIMQSEIVKDIRAKYDPVWRRRELRDARYSEATRPNVPSILLELLSHQNFLDNKFQSDPRFRFDVSRAIYKSIAKFIAHQNDYEFIAQPLPPTHFNTNIDSLGNIVLKWKPQEDILESSAKSTGFIVYKKIGDGGFDNGIFVKDSTYYINNVNAKEIYSFKVTAVNDGGESFASEILSIGIINPNSKPVLIVNGFDRICGPLSINSGNFSGFLSNYDAGVPDKIDISFTGYQHNFDSGSNWTTDDMPGHGASYADYENKIIAGNTFDFSKVHGESLVNAGYSFVSCSDESVWNGDVDLNDFALVDIIMGEEKETPWPKSYTDSLYGKQFKTFPNQFKNKVKNYLENGGNIFLSGAYIGTDLFYRKNKTDSDVEFGKSVLKFKLDSDHAVNDGKVYSVNSKIFPKNNEFEFNTKLNMKIYAVEAPDAIGPVNNSKTVFRYKDNDTSAGVAYKNEYGIISIGFPFETIKEKKTRNLIMKNVVEYLIK